MVNSQIYCLPGSQVQLIASQQTSSIVALAAYLDAEMGWAVIVLVWIGTY